MGIGTFIKGTRNQTCDSKTNADSFSFQISIIITLYNIHSLYLTLIILGKELEINSIWLDILDVWAVQWGWSVPTLAEPYRLFIDMLVSLLNNPCPCHYFYRWKHFCIYLFPLPLGQVQSNQISPATLPWESEVKAPLPSSKPTGKIDPEQLKLPQCT